MYFLHVLLASLNIWERYRIRLAYQIICPISVEVWRKTRPIHVSFNDAVSKQRIQRRIFGWLTNDELEATGHGIIEILHQHVLPTSSQRPRKTSVLIVGVPVEISNPEPPKNYLATLSLRQPARPHSFGGPKQWAVFYRFSALRVWNEYTPWDVRGNSLTRQVGRQLTYLPAGWSCTYVFSSSVYLLLCTLQLRVYLLLQHTHKR